MQRLAWALIFAGVFASEVQATWSLAKLEPDSKSIVVAGASCSYMVYGIATVVPAAGVVIVQAASSADARTHAADELAKGTPLTKIAGQLTDSKAFADYADQQFSLLSFAEWQTPRAYTGDRVGGTHGVKTAPGISVQANTMSNDRVVPAVFAALTGKAESDLALASQALQALAAGSAVGGDTRCGEAKAATAFLTLFRGNDPAGAPYINLVVYGIEPGSKNAVEVLQVQFDRWKKTETGQRSSQVFVLP